MVLISRRKRKSLTGGPYFPKFEFRIGDGAYETTAGDSIQFHQASTSCIVNKDRLLPGFTKNTKNFHMNFLTGQ